MEFPLRSVEIWLESARSVWRAYTAEGTYTVSNRCISRQNRSVLPLGKLTERCMGTYKDPSRAAQEIAQEIGVEVDRMDGDTPDADPGPGADRSAQRDFPVSPIGYSWSRSSSQFAVCDQMIRIPLSDGWCICYNSDIK
jgi:hypothetical protein